MTRVDWHTYFMNIAKEAAKRSTCDRKHVGAVIVRDKTILSTGYNGSIRGMPHCDDVGHLMDNGHCVDHGDRRAVPDALQAEGLRQPHAVRSGNDSARRAADCPMDLSRSRCAVGSAYGGDWDLEADVLCAGALAVAAAGCGRRGRGCLITGGLAGIPGWHR